MSTIKRVLAFMALVLGLCVAHDAHAQNLTVKITRTNGQATTVMGKESLEAAIDTIPLGDVQQLEISAGTFITTDWEWLRANRDSLNVLAHFTITDGASGVADIPDAPSTYDPETDTTIFITTFNGRSIKTLNVAKVANIGRFAFRECTSLTTANFPQATSIGSWTFNGCTSLSTATFPQATSIGSWTFNGCTSLSTADFPQATTIGYGTFGLCTALTAVDFPQVTSMDTMAFRECSSLTTATFPKATSIGLYAFKDCPSLNTIYLGATPPTVEHAYAFEDCPTVRYLVPTNASGTALTGTALESAIQQYKADPGYNADDDRWYGWILETYTVTVDPGITHGTLTATPSNDVQYGTSVRLTTTSDEGYQLKPGSLIAYKTGYATTTAVAITNGTFTMPAYDVTVTAKFEESNLQVTIITTTGNTYNKSGATLEDAIDTIPLGDVQQLEISAGDFTTTDWNWLKTYKAAFSSLERFTITEGASSVADIPNTTSTGPYFNPSSLKTLNVAKVAKIGNYAFEDCTKLSTANFPQVASIGNYAFKDCTSLTTATIPQATSIGDKAFGYCKALTTANFPQATSIGNSAFNQCRALTTADFPQVDSIGNYAFDYCEALTTANFPQATSIGKYAFDYCKALTTADFPQATSIGNYAFADCEALTTANFPQVDSIGNSAFDYCKALTTANFPQATSIGNYAFEKCSALTTASFPKTTIIGNAAFEKCSVLNSISLPQVDSMAYRAFFDCLTLSNLFLGATPPTVANTSVFASDPFSPVTLPTRYLVLTDAMGELLEGEALETAKLQYQGDSGYTDGKWYGWLLEGAPMYNVTVDTLITNGTLTATPSNDVQYGTTVRLTTTSDEGYQLKPGSLRAYKTGDATTTVAITNGTFTMPAYDVTVTAKFEESNLQVTIITTTGNTYNKSGATLEAAIDTIPLGDVQQLEISAGDFTTTDWTWLRNKRNKLNALAQFTITADVSSVADIPDAPSTYDPETGLTIFITTFNGLSIETLNVAKVADIGRGAFYGCQSLTTANFPQATSIGNDAFNECESLATANFPQATSIGNYAFRNCTSLTTATIPQATSIGFLAFYGCTSLTAATFPQATSIDQLAFGSCASLNKLYLGATPPTVEDSNAFEGCLSPRNLMLTDTIGTPLTGSALSNAVQNYRAHAGYNPADDRWYGWMLLDESVDTYNVTVDTLITNGTLTATPSNDVQYGTTVRLTTTSDEGYQLKPGSLRAYKTGDATTTVAITNGTFTMPAYDVTVTAVFEVNNLQVTIITTTGNTYNKSGATLEAAIDTIPLGDVQQLEISAGDFTTTDWTWLRNKRNKLNALAQFTITADVSSVADIPDTDPGRPYFNRSSMRTVNVAKVKNIGKNAFRECIALTTAVFPQATSIGNFAFLSCTTLNTADFPKAEMIGAYAFFECKALATASFPQATNLGDYAFRNCDALTRADFPQATSIGDGAFRKCRALPTASFPLVTSIGEHAFYDCNALTNTDFPQATSVGDSAFHSCTLLPTANFPKVIDIGFYAFRRCTALTTANFPQATSIGNSAFEKCSALNKLYLGATPPTVENSNAFEGCLSPRNLMLTDTIGTPLTGSALSNAVQNYRAHAGYNPADDRWYGWILETYTVTVDSGITHGTLTATPNNDVLYGTTVRLTATPDDGYEMVEGSMRAYKTGDENVTVAVTNGTFNMPAFNVTVTCEFEAIPYTVSVEDGISHGTLTASPCDSVTIGTRVNLTATPDEGYEMVEGSMRAYKTGDENVTVAVTNGTFNMPAYDVTVTCEFEAIPYTVSVEDGISNGTLTASPNTNVTIGTQVSLTATPDEGYEMVEGSMRAYKTGDESVTVAVTNGTFNMPAYDVTVTCEFEAIPYTVSVEDGISHGTLTASPNTNVTIGTQVSLTATPDEGYEMVEGSMRAYKTGDENVTVAITNGTFNMPAYDVTVTCEFEAIPYTVSVEDGISNGILTASPCDNVTIGTQVSLTATPDEGYEMVEGSMRAYKTGDENVTVAVTNGTFNMPAFNVTVTCEFEAIPYTVSVEDGISHGTLTASPCDNVTIGTQVSLTATPDEGYEMVEGSMRAYKTGDENVTVAVTNGTFNMPAYDVTVTCEFEAIPYTVSVEDGISHGILTASPCDNVTIGTQVSLTATPDEGYEMVEGSMRAYKTGDENVTVAVTNGTFNMPAFNVTVTCEFEAIPYTVSVEDGISNGTLTASPNNNVTIGTQVSLTATPDEGYEMVEGSMRAYKTGDENVTVAVTNGTFNMPAYDVTVTCEFEAIPYTVSVEDGISNGTLTASPNTNVTIGTQVSLTATPDEGYEMVEGSMRAYKTGDENVTVAVTNGTFTMPAYDVTVTCEFEAIPYTVSVEGGISHGILTASPCDNVTIGTQVSLTATPDEGYEMVEGSMRAYKTGDENVTVAVTNGAFNMPAFNVTVTCEFEAIPYTVSVEDGISHGILTASPCDNVTIGTQVSLTATPDEGYEMVEGSMRAYKTGDENVTVAVTNGTFNMPAFNVTVTCEFEAIPYTVSVEDGISNGTLTASPNNNVTIGTQVSLTATPDEGYEMVEGSMRAYKTGDENVTVAVTNGTFNMPAYDVTVTCEFEAIPYTVSVEDGISNGTLTASPCDNVTIGTQVSLTATPDEGYEMVEGSMRAYKTGDENVTVAVTNGTFNMPAYDVTVTCEFEAIPYTVSVEDGISNGTLTASPNNNVTIGTQVNLTATPDEGYEMVEGSMRAYKTGDENVTVAITNGTFNMPAYDVTVTCEFEAIPYTVSVEDGISNGTLTASPNNNVTIGTQVNLTATPDEGYEMVEGSMRAYKTGDENVTVAVTNGTFTMPAYDVTVTCEFTETTNVDDTSISALTLFPNPASDKVGINGLETATMVRVYSTNGILVLEQLLEPDQRLNIGNLPEGLYLVKVNGQTLKLMKNNIIN